MKIRFLLFIFLITTVIGANAQSDYLIVDGNIRLPKDSILQTKLVKNLDSFLYSIKKNEKIEDWLLPEEKCETQILIDGIKSFTTNNALEVKPHLINLEMLDDKKSYSVQVAYISYQNSSSSLKAIFEFIVHKNGSDFLISSPLRRYTREWRTKTAGHLIFHYQNNLVENVSDQYVRIVNDYDRKLGISKTTEYYFCDNCEETTSLLRLVGMQYNVNYNGYSWPMVDFHSDEKIIAIYNQDRSRKEFVDPHDIFHGRANIVIPSNVRNYYMICGCAYIYGGTWNGTWRVNWSEIQKRFKETLFKDRNVDWLRLYFERYNFGESEDQPILVTQFINALIIQKVEKEKGYSNVMKLFASGNMYKNRDTFF